MGQNKRKNKGAKATKVTSKCLHQSITLLSNQKHLKLSMTAKAYLKLRMKSKKLMCAIVWKLHVLDVTFLAKNADRKSVEWSVAVIETT